VGAKFDEKAWASVNALAATIESKMAATRT